MRIADRHLWIYWFVFVILAFGSPTGHSSAAQPQQIQYFCEEQIAPDQLVIAGGVSAQSISPAQAGLQVDARINKIKAFLLTQRGSLVMQDRLRAARNPDPRERKAGEELLPFLQIQRFEAILPVNTNIDQVLESLFKLGMDRYGKNVRIDDYSDRNFAALTRYRFSALRPRLESLVARCRAAKLKMICPNAKACELSGGYASINGKYVTEDGKREFTLNLAGEAMLGRITETLEPSGATAISFEIQGSVNALRLDLSK